MPELKLIALTTLCGIMLSAAVSHFLSTFATGRLTASEQAYLDSSLLQLQKHSLRLEHTNDQSAERRMGIW